MENTFHLCGVLPIIGNVSSLCGARPKASAAVQ